MTQRAVLVKFFIGRIRSLLLPVLNMVPFCKFHGFGNDYIVIENRFLEGVDQQELAVAICNRHTGVGADGIAVIDRLSGAEADMSCEIVNPDGSIAGFSGNGTRCAVSYAYFKDIWSADQLRLKTRSGVKHYRLLETPSPGHYVFEAEIGRPKFVSNEIPVATPEERKTVIDLHIVSEGREFVISCVNVGNPVACIFVEDFDLEWSKYGQRLETHSIFPDRANIVFVKVIDRSNIEIRIWERAAGETTASGTCASGSAVLSAFTGRTRRKVAVHSEGGTTNCIWRDDDEIVITGRADLAFCGEWPD